MSETFKRPDLSSDELSNILKLATSLVNVRGRVGSVGTVVLLLGENIRLTKEVNLHREKLGYELLPIHDPKI